MPEDSGHSPLPRDGRVLSIQYFRALASLMVVLHHATNQFSEFPALFHTKAGQAGVDLFFVISGFVMVFVTSTREQSPGTFIKSRVTRIVPIYWVYTLLCFVLLSYAPRLFTANESSARHLILSLLFIPHTIANSPQDAFNPLIKLGWTLNYEMFFYAVFAIAMAISFTGRIALTVGVLVVLVASRFVAHLLGIEIQGIAVFYTYQIVCEFALGMIIAQLYFLRRLRWPSPILGVLLIPGGLIAMSVGGPWMGSMRLFVFGIPAAVMLVGALAIERRGIIKPNRALLLIGDASYSIYLVHIFSLAILRALWLRLDLPITGYVFPTLFVLICLLCGLLSGVASYLLVERRLLRWTRTLLSSRRLAKSSANQAV